MKNSFRTVFKKDPLEQILDIQDKALEYFIRNDILQEKVLSTEKLWELPEAVRILKKQQQNGSWNYPGAGKKKYPEFNYDLLETYRQLGILVDKYGFNKKHPAIEKAAEYIFSCQTEEGDIRGILGNQHIPYYMAVIVERLITAGYSQDPRIEKGLKWLLKMRQDDGGWIIPMQAVKQRPREIWNAPPVEPEREKPFSHLATGMILRAFAVCESYQGNKSILKAAQLLKSRFFKADKYNDRKGVEYWTKFQYPFWWSNLLTSLDTLSLLNFSREDKDIEKALEWFVRNQKDDGLWDTSYENKNKDIRKQKEENQRKWVSLAVCRVFKRYYGD